MRGLNKKSREHILGQLEGGKSSVLEERNYGCGGLRSEEDGKEKN